jgi:hypothetical protein
VPRVANFFRIAREAWVGVANLLDRDLSGYPRNIVNPEVGQSPVTKRKREVGRRFIDAEN